MKLERDDLEIMLDISKYMLEDEHELDEYEYKMANTMLNYAESELFELYELE